MRITIRIVTAVQIQILCDPKLKNQLDFHGSPDHFPDPIPSQDPDHRNKIKNA